MKLQILALILFSFILKNAKSQSHNHDFCLLDTTSQSFDDEGEGPDMTSFTPYGKVFTPTGDIRFLVIYVEKESFALVNGVQVSSFDPLHPQYNNGAWSQEPSGGLPATKTFPYYRDMMFYTDNNQFSFNSPDYNVSAFYYHMSMGNFRVTADYFPEKINIPHNQPNDNIYILDYIQQHHPTFDWSPYDQRTNSPDYLADNSVSSPDGKLDYVILMYRDFNRGYAQAGVTLAGNVTPSGVTPAYQITGQGCTFFYVDNYFLIMGTITHEISHNLFDSPHYAGNHSAVGDKFYGSAGWSSMSYTWDLGMLVNAWERWLCGWINLNSSNDINSASQNGTYVLQDYVTTGDAMRIKIPHPTRNTYLWIENHQKISIADNTPINVFANNEPIPANNPGLYMFVEDMNTPTLNNPPNDVFNPSSTNGIKFMHAHGNHDYSYLGYSPFPPLWDNNLFDFKQESPNPMGAHNNLAFIRHDYTDILEVNCANNPLNTNPLDINTYPGREHGRIGYSIAIQSDPVCYPAASKLNEHQAIGSIDGDLYLAYKGYEAGFDQVGQKLGISHNPAIIPHQKYNPATQRLETIPLNGISIEILSIAGNGDITIEVKYNDVDIEEDQRFTGQLALNDIPDAPADLVIKPGKTLTVDHSGTPNRQTRGNLVNGEYEYPDFVTPTILTLESGSKTFIELAGKLLVKEKSTLHIKAGAELLAGKAATVEIGDGAYLCVEPGADFRLIHSFARLKVAENAHIGANPLLGISPAGCLDRCELQALFATNGSTGIIDRTYLVNAGDDKEFCIGADSWQLGDSDNPAGNYDWTPPDHLDDPHSPYPTASPVEQTITYTVFYEDTHGCTDKDEITLTVHPMPEVTIHSLGNGCTDMSFDISGVDPVLVAGYDWAFGQGATPATSTAANPTGISYATTGAKTVFLDITMTNGCVFTYYYDHTIHFTGCCNSYGGTVSTGSGPSYTDFIGSQHGVPVLSGGGHFSGNFQVDGDLLLENGTYECDQATYLYMVGGYDPADNTVYKSKITLSNAQLLLQGATVNRDCGQMWWGIHLTNGSRIEMMDNARLEHSLVGIYSENGEALNELYIENGHFYNNLLSSVYDNFSGMESNGNSAIRGNQFYSDPGDMAEPFNTGTYFPLTYLTFAGDMGDYRPVGIQYNKFHDAHTGIYVPWGAYIEVTEGNEFHNIYRAGIYTGGYFNIEGNTFHVPAQAQAMANYPVSGTPWAGNGLGNISAPAGVLVYRAVGVNEQAVRGNVFYGQNGSSASFDHAGVFTGDGGSLPELSYRIEHNEFTGLGAGISDPGRYVNSSELRGNRFFNCAYGVFVRFSPLYNGNPHNTQTRITCNDFVKTYSTPTYATYGIFVETSAYLNDLGECPQDPQDPSKPAGNEFLPSGYPTSYINNGEDAIFPGGYDWNNNFEAVANWGNNGGLTYHAYLNENIGGSFSLVTGSITLNICTDYDPPYFVLKANTGTCPGPSGASNRVANPVREWYVPDFKISPNPTNGKVLVQLGEEEIGLVSSIMVMDMQGNLIRHIEQVQLGTGTDFEIDMSGHPSGMYRLSLLLGDGRMLSKMLILAK